MITRRPIEEEVTPAERERLETTPCRRGAEAVLAELVALVMLTALAAYAVLGGADFGVGVWDLTAGRGPRAHALRGRLERSMGPVWEANHVWLIFVLVACWTGFPTAFGAIMSTLYIPMFLAAIGIILRGSMYAFVACANPRHRAWLGLVFAAASILTPFFLGAAVGGIASGRVPLGNAEGDPITSWWNPTSIMVGVLAVVTGAYLAAVGRVRTPVARASPSWRRPSGCGR